jgi:hypothetical protein
MENLKMKKHVTLAGSVQIGFSVLGLIAAVTVFIGISFARGFVGNDDVARNVLGFISISLPLLIGGLSTLGIVGGVGLLAYKSWARYLVLIIAALGCLNIPFGTAKGVYIIWVLVQDDTVKLFGSERQ